MTDVKLRPRAFAKAVLHALKYPHRPVFGVLLAHSEGIPEEESPSKPGPVTVEDAWALFHSPPTCVPMLELSLMQVDDFCQRQKLRVVGLYAANQPSSSRDSQEDGSNTSSTSSSTLIEAGSGSTRARSCLPQDLLRVASTHSYLLMLDASGLRQALSPEEGFTSSAVDQDSIFQVYTTAGSGTWLRAPGTKAEVKKSQAGTKSEIESEGLAATASGIALELVREYAKEPWMLQDGFTDFEDHLDDIARDWLNEHLLK